MVNMNIVANDILSVAKLFKRTFGTPLHRPHMSTHTITHTIAIIEPNTPNRNTHEMIHSSWHDAYE